MMSNLGKYEGILRTCLQWGSIEVNKEEMSYPISLVCPGTLLHEHMHPLGGENGGPFWIGTFIRNRSND